MTFFLLKDNKSGKTKFVRWRLGLCMELSEVLKDYKMWLQESKNRKCFLNNNESLASKGGIDGFIYYLKLVGKPMEVFTDEQFFAYSMDIE